MTPTTRRYPRTMTEAFGPYHHLAPLHVEYMPMRTRDKISVAVGVVLLILAACLAYAGVI